MKRILSLLAALILIFSSVKFSNASPLVFSAQKEIKWGEFINFGTFDASKFDKLRITVKANDLEHIDSISISGGNDKEKVSLSNADFRLSHTQIIDTPPEKISISIKGEGVFSLYVWASQ